jgi:Protein of unknown function (DUF1592)/Protein of unknown function (DUF1588)/Protein of unknown function (DUF1585)/Protein of unknown function (DUF1587)/Protein of unknown function (DUF1595)
MGGVSLQQLTAQASVGESFAAWGKVAAVLEQNRMPPKGMPQPSDTQRQQAVTWIRAELTNYAKKHDGDPGRVTVRRLTSGEYAYAIHDLTGIDPEAGIDAASDSVGGEGFTSFGDVQFMQDANLERYLAAAKIVANHAVIGAGPLEFFADPGKTGFELSAINRIKNIYATQGFRTVSGEGGYPFGLEKYGKVFYTTWRYQHRVALGEPNVTLKDLAIREGISPRFAQHIWTVMNQKSLSYPSSEMAAQWHKLPVPGAGDPAATVAAARTGCEELQKSVTNWPGWLFGRGDQAAGGQGDESPLVFSDKSLGAEPVHHFNYNRGGRGPGGRAAAPAGPAKIYLNVASLNPSATGKPVILWRNPTVSYRKPGAPGRGQSAGGKVIVVTPPADEAADGQPVVQTTGGRGFGQSAPAVPLRTVVSEETARRLAFGKSPDGTPVGPDDFASEGSINFEIPLPAGVIAADFQVDAGIGADRDQVFRIMISDREGAPRGIPMRAIVGDMQSAGYRKFKAGVMELVALMPPNSNIEPTPADKDPAPEPLDSTYNTPEHDAFINDVKFVREDSFIYQHMLDDATRARLDNAWTDLHASFAYHDNYLRLLAEHFKLDLKVKHMADLDKAQIDAMPAEARKYIAPLQADFVAVRAAEAAARPRHLADCLQFAAVAWRHPLSDKEKQGLRSFYDKTMTSEGDHDKAIRALLTRILVSPEFLYRVEQPTDTAAAKPLSNWDLASRMSFFLWSSIPDEELRRAAGAGELSNPQQVQRQVKRMLADAKARRLSTEFFGQWLGFYRFDQFRGVDTARFPEFTDEVKTSMYDEAISFFEYVLRQDRPVRDILFADYDFLNQPLAKFYGVKKEIKSTGPVELVEGANAFQRGGLLRLGAILTTTSAPLRTSPVKRGDWVLRRILGTPVPPPPANVPKLPADEKDFGSLTLRQTLEAHKNSPACANCHLRIDPLGFPMEHYDSTGRYRALYADGKPIDDSGVLTDHTEIAGVPGLLDYLKKQEDQVRRTLATKLVGYALGRTVQPSDQLLIDRMVATGGNATFSQLAAEIITSRQFRNHLGRDDAPPTATAALKSNGVSAR